MWPAPSFQSFERCLSSVASEEGCWSKPLCSGSKVTANSSSKSPELFGSRTLMCCSQRKAGSTLHLSKSAWAASSTASVSCARAWQQKPRCRDVLGSSWRNQACRLEAESREASQPASFNPCAAVRVQPLCTWSTQPAKQRTRSLWAPGWALRSHMHTWSHA